MSLQMPEARYHGELPMARDGGFPTFGRGNPTNESTIMPITRCSVITT